MSPLRIVLALWSGLSFLSAAPPEWQVLEPCWFREDLPYDADSFYLQLPDETVVLFRLYEVDAPETSNQHPERVLAQSLYFDLTRQETIEKGDEARGFVAYLLREEPLVVRTLWRRVLSPDSNPRYAAHVETSCGDLGEILLHLGLVRPHGYKSPLKQPVYLLGRRSGID
jgi:endonuclease YncB( thermonuclease family)